MCTGGTIAGDITGDFNGDLISCKVIGSIRNPRRPLRIIHSHVLGGLCGGTNHICNSCNIGCTRKHGEECCIIKPKGDQAPSGYNASEDRCRRKCTIILSATGAPDHGEWPRYLGTYVVNGEEEEGAEVYRKSDGRYVHKYLYKHRSGTWRVGLELGDLGYLRSVPGDTAECPASIKQWQYNAGGSWHNGDITAQCSVHT